MKNKKMIYLIPILEYALTRKTFITEPEHQLSKPTSSNSKEASKSMTITGK